MVLAEEAHRVALADAHDAYEAALARAAADLLAAVDRADRILGVAHAREQAAERDRERLAAYYQDRAEGLLKADLERFQYMLSPPYAVHRDRSLDDQVRTHIDVISAALARRGVDVS
jgi:hypothetical protein